MSEKSMKISVEIPGWKSSDSTSLLNEIKEKVSSHLTEQNLEISEAIINKSCKNACPWLVLKRELK